jgi:DNA processing protein
LARLQPPSEIPQRRRNETGWRPRRHSLLTLASAYPQALLTTPDPPPVLFAVGRVDLLNRPGIAIVGSRNATQQGVSNAEGFATALARAGVTVVSGLALGIDAAAHRGALAADADASTVAVVGTGVDIVYPASNRELMKEIRSRGVVVSEFALRTPAIAHNFPRRNRIIAGLARGVLVVEAALRSGSLITARLAAEAGREVFAIPGSIHSPLARGCHRLIRDGAKLVEPRRTCRRTSQEKLAPAPGRPRPDRPPADLLRCSARPGRPGHSSNAAAQRGELRAARTRSHNMLSVSG